MTARFASLVCCLGLIASVRAADAQTAKGSEAPPAAPPDSTVSAPAAAKPASVPAGANSDDETEKDELGRSKWWPAAPAKPSRPAPPTTERDEQGRSKWWPASPAPGRITLADSAPEPPLLPFQKGILFLPYLGLSYPIGSNSGSYATGHNFGAMIGVHLTRGFSFTTEINVDYMNPGPLATETQTDFTLGPLFQSSGARHFWVLGLKLGRFNITRSVGGGASYDSYDSGTIFSRTGFVWGVTFGGFIPVGPVALGGLARITARYLSSNCDEGTDSTICHDGGSKGISPALTTLNLSVAALF